MNISAFAFMHVMIPTQCLAALKAHFPLTWCVVLYPGTQLMYDMALIRITYNAFSPISSDLICSNINNIFINLGFFWHFETFTYIRTWIKSHKYWRNVVRCKYFKAVGHIKNPIKNSCQDGLGRTILKGNLARIYNKWHVKFNSILTPHIHCIVWPKIILPMPQTFMPTMAYLALETAYFSFATKSFACIASTFLKITALQL